MFEDMQLYIQTRVVNFIKCTLIFLRVSMVFQGINADMD